MDADRAHSLFVGLPIDMRCVRSLAECAETLSGAASRANLGLRFVAPSSYHLTLAYLGEVYSAAVLAVAEQLALMKPPELLVDYELAGVDAFDSLTATRVLYARVDRGRDALSDLAAKVRGCVAELGYAVDDNFVPHVTLARADGIDASEVAGPWQTKEFGVCRAREMNLYAGSREADGGYRVVRHFSLEP